MIATVPKLPPVQSADLTAVSDDQGIAVKVTTETSITEFALSAEQLARLGWFRVTGVRDGAESPVPPG